MNTPASDASHAPLLGIEPARAAIIASTAPISGDEEIALHAARGRVLARAIASPRALPVFDHSAMDGYALALAPNTTRYKLVGRIAAGQTPRAALKSGEAMRIFTGAPVPAGASAVAMQENVTALDGEIELKRAPRAGDNIRHAGEDVAAGEALAQAGIVLDARHIGLAAAVGIGELKVLRRLRVALVSTGDELTQAGDALGEGAIFDSNRPMLLASLERPALAIEDFGILRDDRAAISAFFQDCAEKSDPRRLRTSSENTT